ncbi:putative aldehyde dehydrogenase DhaS [Choanephora cucurbitarum]|uniref:Putative aldehyde dehydrogenase DhaS n=1 Tax=Choanephora cucurbitarum TaxID=101091 RepID=A0A1C7NHA4_9FUNG|nr:putative aldehyde dehydrogenase DhaS [Choanephora cucurbitarum]
MSRLWLTKGKQWTPYIHGQFTRPLLSPRKIVKPADITSSFEIVEASTGQVQEALISAKHVSVSSDWQTNHKFRRDCLLALAQTLEKNEHTMAQLESSQTGKPLSDSLYEVNDAVDCLRYFAGCCDKLYGQSHSFHNMYAFTTREPLGTVSLITSFNYPLLLTCWKLGPALAAGNCAIVKPAPQTPLSSLALADLATDILPPGVLNVLPGGVDVGQALVDHTDKTSFTGSTRVGQDIMRQAANRLLPLTLECGGKNAAIVCEDTNLPDAANHVAMGAFSNAGQNCCAISRVLVQQSVYDEFLDRLTNIVHSSWRATSDIKDSEDHQLYGPLIDRHQYTRVKKYIETNPTLPLITGNIQNPDKGYYIAPTVFVHVPDDSPLATEEIFGPVLSILSPFEHLDEAIERVNTSEYGLAAGVFSQDLRKAHIAASQIRAGYVWINTYNIMPPSLPFGGRSLSGIGKDLGQSAIDAFSFQKSVMVAL